MIRLYNMPFHWQREGLGTCLLAAFGYGSGSGAVVTGEWMGALSGHPCIGNGEAIILEVKPPAGDEGMWGLPKDARAEFFVVSFFLFFI